MLRAYRPILIGINGKDCEHRPLSLPFMLFMSVARMTHLVSQGILTLRQFLFVYNAIGYGLL